MTDTWDAIVVGLGASGAILAQALAQAGARVLGIEKGAGPGQGGTIAAHDEIRQFIRGELLPGMATDPITWRPRPGCRAVVLPWAQAVYPLADPFHLPPSNGVGGGTLHWTAASWRFRASDFRMRTAIDERFGRHALPDGTGVVDWPVDYAELEPYYDRVEWEFGVAGTAGNIGGVLADGGNPFEAPRRRHYPLPPLRRGPADHLFATACQRLGYHPFPQPAAIASLPYRGRPACTYCGFCHGYPCHVGAKATTSTCVSQGLRTGNLRVLTGARVLRIGRRSGRRAGGVTYLAPDGRLGRAQAPLVVLACYTLENTRLLLLSGIGADGQVGRWFMTHNYGDLTGVLPDRANGFMGAQAGASVIDDLSSESVPDNDLGVLWGSPVISVPGDFQPLEAAHMRPASVPRWGRPLKKWLKDNFRHLYGMCSQTASLPSRAAFCDLDPHVSDPWGRPALRITHDWTDYDQRAAELMLGVKRAIAREMGLRDWWEASPAPVYHISNHDAGTYRMGCDPVTSVVDPYGECHTCPGLYVLGGGQFPTLGGYNPTQTIQALAVRTADHIIGRRAASAAGLAAAKLPDGLAAGKLPDALVRR